MVGSLNLNQYCTTRGGATNMFKVDVDKMSYFELMDFVMDLKTYKNKDFEMFYLVPGMKFEEGLVQLKSDKDVNEMMLKLREDVRHILHLYVQGNYSITKTHLNPDIAQTSNIVAQHSCLEAHTKTPQTTPQIQQGITKSSARRLPTTPQEKNILIKGISSESESSDEGSNGSGSDSDDEDWIASESDNDDEEWRVSVAALKVNKEKQLSNKDLVAHLLKGIDVNSHGDKLVEDQTSDASSYEDSEGDVNSPGESEEDDIRGNKNSVSVPVVRDNTYWSKWIWVVGTRFPTRDAFKKAVRYYAVYNGRNLIISASNKNRHGRLGASCVTGCPFKVYLSFHAKKGCYMVKSANNEHSCQRNMVKNRQLTGDFIAEYFLPIFKANPNWKAKEIQDAVKEKFKVIIGKWLAYKAKSAAHRKLHGSMMEHYGKLGSYLEALKQVNHGSTFELLTVPPQYYELDSNDEVFFRLFVCFDPVKKGFLAGCRRLLCLDGCFLKTFLGGMLLVAIGRDANGQMYPVAWAVVEGENNDSWTWFMNELKKCLEVTDDGKGWTLVSDQQKGLVNAVAEIWNKAEHRNCARHIYANWHKKFKGDDLKELF